MSAERGNLARALDARAADVAVALLGAPAQRRGPTWRWGSRGSLAVEVAGIKRGRWFNHEAGVGGDMLALVTIELRGSFREAVAWAERFIAEPPGRPWPMRVATSSNGATRPAADKSESMERARRIWNDSVPIMGSLAEVYLAARGLPLPATGELRFHPATPRRSGERLPAMIGLMRDPETGERVGIHRTFLRPDGSDRIRDDLGKMMLGRAGVVALDRRAGSPVLHVAEGIETALAVRALGGAPAWAMTSAGAIARFRVLPDVQELRIWADSDSSEAGMRAAATCSVRWRGAGRVVSILRPREVGSDWADVVRARGAAA